jgi:hypothetical protein
MAKRLALATAAALATGGLLLTNPLSANAATSVLTPIAMVTTAGTGADEPVSNLARQDLSGTTDGWNRYVEFSGRYDGYLNYALPDTLAASSITGIQVRVNYRGPGPATQIWHFELCNWVSLQWVTVGSNATAPDWGRWTVLTFTASGKVADYVSSSGGLRLRLWASNAADAADIDYAAVVLTTSPGSPPPTATSSAAPTVARTTAAPTPPATTPAKSSPTASARTSATSSPPAGMPVAVDCPGCWHPGLRVSWNWVLAKVPTAPYRSVQMYDIDGFDATTSNVASLHAAGMRVICYLSVGSYENWRPDASSFPASILGNNLDGWPGERWLDVRGIQQPSSALAKIMNARLDMCKSKGFDAVELDNMDGYTNNTGFPLTAAQQASYDAYLANGARQRGLSAVMKNDLDQVSTLLPYFDMALNEQCNQYNECDPLKQFVQAGKPVVNAEYSSSTSFCTADNAANFNGLNLSINLDDSRFQTCR